MIVKTLDNHEVKWQLKSTGKKISKLHQRAIEVIQGTLPGVHILQEVAIPVRKGKKLYLDVYLLKQMVAIEIMGAQHGKRVKHFQTSDQFRKQVDNDGLKAMWCQVNNIPLIYFEHDETEQIWRAKLLNVLFPGLHIPTE